MQSMDPKQHIVLESPDSCGTCGTAYKCVVKTHFAGSRYGYTCISCKASNCDFTDERLRGRARLSTMIDDGQSLLTRMRRSTGVKKVPQEVIDHVLAGIDALRLLHDDEKNWEPFKSKRSIKKEETAETDLTGLEGENGRESADQGDAD